MKSNKLELSYYKSKALKKFEKSFKNLSDVCTRNNLGIKLIWFIFNIFHIGKLEYLDMKLHKEKKNLKLVRSLYNSSKNPVRSRNNTGDTLSICQDKSYAWLLKVLEEEKEKCTQLDEININCKNSLELIEASTRCKHYFTLSFL